MRHRDFFLECQDQFFTSLSYDEFINSTKGVECLEAILVFFEKPQRNYYKTILWIYLCCYICVDFGETIRARETLEFPQQGDSKFRKIFRINKRLFGALGFQCTFTNNQAIIIKSKTKSYIFSEFSLSKYATSALPATPLATSLVSTNLSMRLK